MPDKNGYYLQFPLGTTIETVRSRCIERFGREPLEIFTVVNPSGKNHSIWAGPYPKEQPEKEPTP